MFQTTCASERQDSPSLIHGSIQNCTHVAKDRCIWWRPALQAGQYQVLTIWTLKVNPYAIVVKVSTQMDSIAADIGAGDVGLRASQFTHVIQQTHSHKSIELQNNNITLPSPDQLVALGILLVICIVTQLTPAKHVMQYQRTDWHNNILCKRETSLTQLDALWVRCCLPVLGTSSV